MPNLVSPPGFPSPRTALASSREPGLKIQPRMNPIVCLSIPLGHWGRHPAQHLALASSAGPPFIPPIHKASGGSVKVPWSLPRTQSLCEGWARSGIVKDWTVLAPWRCFSRLGERRGLMVGFVFNDGYLSNSFISSFMLFKTHSLDSHLQSKTYQKFLCKSSE